MTGDKARVVSDEIIDAVTETLKRHGIDIDNWEAHPPDYEEIIDEVVTGLTMMSTRLWQGLNRPWKEYLQVQKEIWNGWKEEDHRTGGKYD
ncbi:MAG: hypothetical protein M1144_06330 [Candidatus Thermoplasmatota archaeon]|jgi:hypothetical protein|nr:hypothetical protein [Candidatus Thermoplasmatota archaeon]MDG6912973.1 hypothetical protein [Nitrososphaerota archaeon]